MKKLSRILSRRRPDDGGATDSSSDSPRRSAGGPAATGFHQLPSRRARGSDVVLARTHRELRSGVSGGCIVADGTWADAAIHNHSHIHVRDDTSSEVSDVSEQSSTARKPFLTKPCPRCAAIDFPQLLDWKQGLPRPWVPLSHVLLPPPSLPPSPPADSDQAKGQLPPGAPQCPFCIFFRAMIGPILAVGDGTAKFHPYLRIRQAFERVDGIGEKHELAGSVMMEVMTKKKSLPWGYLLKADELDDDAGLSYTAAPWEKARVCGRQVPALVNPVLPKCWLGFCKKNHAAEGCTAPAEPVEGLRLIDCSEMRVVAAEDIDGDALEYLTLSYVWSQTGLDSSPDTPFDVSALSLKSNGHLPESVPSLFADAIAFTNTLGYRYLWIDRFCLQVSPAHRQAQIELMGEIYSRSSLTLIIAAEENTLTGIPGLSTPRDEQLSLKTKNGLYTTSLIRPDLEIASSKWASRAWTFQEGLLSRRRLIFTPSQIYFQCRALHCYESISLPLRLAPDFTLGRVFPLGDGEPKQSGQFKDLVKEYMCRELGNNEERLDAIKPVLQQYSRMDDLPVTHFLGLPLFHPDDFVTSRVVSETDRLAASLGWICDWTTSFETPTEPSCYKASSPFPSWTWLSWNLQPGLTTIDNKFAFNLVGDTSPLLDGVSATPKMEISIGFDDATVLSWEIDGDAISKKATAITFLRLETFCCDLQFTIDKGVVKLHADVAMTTANKALIEAMLTASLPDSLKSPEKQMQESCIGVLVSGRNWKEGTHCSATVLICGRRGWEVDGVWERLGAVAVECECFVVDGEQDALVKGVEVLDGEKKDLRVRLRELDLY